MGSVKIDIGRKRKKRNKKLFRFTLITSIIAAVVLFIFFVFRTTEITYEGNKKANEEASERIHFPVVVILIHLCIPYSETRIRIYLLYQAMM